jgi:hypothetical protein
MKLFRKIIKEGFSDQPKYFWFDHDFMKYVFLENILCRNKRSLRVGLDCHINIFK